MKKKNTQKVDVKKTTTTETKGSGCDYSMKNNDLDVMNPATRCPVTLLLDTSASMKGESLEELKKALYTYIKDMKEDIAANSSVELCIITLDEKATTVLPFTCMEDISPVMLDLKASGGTFLGKALTKAKQEINNRRLSFRKKKNRDSENQTQRQRKLP